MQLSMPASRATTGNASQARAGERSGCTRPRYRLDPRALPNSSAKHLDLLVQKSVRVGTHELKQMLLAQLLAELAQKLA